MKTRRFAAALALVTFAGTGQALAQDKGKTEAAKLASESRAASENAHLHCAAGQAACRPRPSRFSSSPKSPKPASESAANTARAPC